MNAQEKVQASFNMIKEHVMNGGEANTLLKIAQQYVKYCR